MLQAPALRKKLASFCRGFDTNAQAATRLKVSAAQLSRALSGKAPLPARLVKRLGYQAVVAYVPLGRTATKTVKVSRDAKTGRTVSKAAAKAHPETTVTETQQRAVKPKRKTDVTKAVKKSISNRANFIHATGSVDAIPEDRRHQVVEAAPEPAHTVIDVTARD